MRESGLDMRHLESFYGSGSGAHSGGAPCGLNALGGWGRHVAWNCQRFLPLSHLNTSPA